MNTTESRAKRLQGKTVIITGASSGIGKASAQLFAVEGANLVLGGRRTTELESLATALHKQGTAVAFLVGDVRDEDYAHSLAKLAIEKFGRLDVGFNNAGIMGDTVPVPEMSAENWHTVISTNLNSAFYAAKYQIPLMKAGKQGSLIFTSSFVGHTAAFPGMGAYAASKAGLIGLTQALATEHGADGIRVNSLLPGGTKTQLAGDLENNPERLSFYNNLHALKRMADPKEIAHAALFLASDEASFITGSALLADGGNSISKI